MSINIEAMRAKLLGGSDEDEVDVDQAKMTAEQIRDYLFGKKTLIDNTSLQMSDLPPNMKKRMFPDAYLYERASLEDKAKYDEMMRGGMNALAFTNAVEDADNEQYFEDQLIQRADNMLGVDLTSKIYPTFPSG